MKQTRGMSLVEAIANVAVGYGVAVVTQILIFPAFGLHTTVAQNLKLGLAFTIVSIVRSFAIRRLFETIRTRRAEQETAAPSGRRRESPIVFRREFCKPDLDNRSSRR
jgi:cobalamin biosynthesis protein CobD/CbiB